MLVIQYDGDDDYILSKRLFFFIEKRKSLGKSYLKVKNLIRKPESKILIVFI